MLFSTHSFADLNCFPASAFIDTTTDAEIKDRINQQPTYYKKINKRKKFYVYGARSVSTNGCNITAVFDVKVARKIRRDARGTMKMTTRLDRFTGCLRDSKVEKFNLSYLLRIGERIYRNVANRKIPDTICL